MTNPPRKIIFTNLVPGKILLDALRYVGNDNGIEFVCDQHGNSFVVGQQSLGNQRRRLNLRAYPNGDDMLNPSKKYGEIHIYAYDWVKGRRLTTRSQTRENFAKEIERYLRNKGYPCL